MDFILTLLTAIGWIISIGLVSGLVSGVYLSKVLLKEIQRYEQELEEKYPC